MTRGRLIALGLVATVLVVAGLLAPEVARRRAETVLALRSGCESATIDSLSLGARSLVLEAVRLRCPFGDVEARRVELVVSWPDLWSGAGPEAARVVGGSVRLVSRPDRPGGLPDGDRSAPHPSVPRMRLEVVDVDVEIVSGAEVLARARISGEGSGRGMTARVTGIETSARHHPAVEIDELAVTTERDSSWAVREVRGRGVRVVSVEGPGLLDAVRAWARTGATADPPLASGATDVAAVPWELLLEGGTVGVEDMSIRDADGIALAHMGAEVVRVAGARFRTEGRGQPRGEGEIAWDVAVDAERGAIDGPVRLSGVPLSVIVPFLPPLPLHDPTRTLISADLRVSTGDGTEVSMEGWARAEGLAVASPRIASEPVLGIGLRVDGAARWRRAEHVVEVERATLRLGSATASVSGRAMMDGDRYAFDLRGSLPPTSCEAAVHAIPAGLLQDLAQMRLDGRIAASVALHVESDALDETVLRFAVDDGCRFLSVPPMADVLRFQAPFHHEVLEPDGSIFAMETGPGTPTWTPITAISPFMVHAVLAHEDASFFTHSGFAPWAIRDALVRNLRERRYVLGASTISMQLVKNVFLRREKTLARKIQEVLLTWWIESSMSKGAILELYLNVIEYGPRVYGIRNAAAHYFGRDPAELSVAEAAYLAMILPNPPRFHEHYEAGVVPPAFLRRTERFVELMRERGRIDLDAAAQGQEELAAFAFSRDGAPVGPPELRGASAQLPIDGFSGFPSNGLADELETAGALDEGEAGEDRDFDEDEHEPTSWVDEWR